MTDKSMCSSSVVVFVVDVIAVLPTDGCTTMLNAFIAFLALKKEKRKKKKEKKKNILYNYYIHTIKGWCAVSLDNGDRNF